jgi:hypothetical protein
MQRVGGNGGGRRMQIDLLIAKSQGAAVSCEGNRLQSEKTGVELAGGFHIADRQNKMVDAVDFQGVPPLLAQDFQSLLDVAGTDNGEAAL